MHHRVLHGSIPLKPFKLLDNFIYFTVLLNISFVFISHDLQKHVVEKEQEKHKILEETKELTVKHAKISQETEKMNQELKNVEK